MCLWKQWKRVRTRVYELRALGVREWVCFVMTNSSMGNVPKHKQCPSDFLLGSEKAQEYAFTLFGALLTVWTRRMRTRMYGGVRGRRLVASSYSIRHSFSANFSSLMAAPSEVNRYKPNTTGLT